MTAQLSGFTDGSDSLLKNSLFAHIPPWLAGQPFPPKGGIYFLLPQRKSMSQRRSKLEAEKGYSSTDQSSA